MNDPDWPMNIYITQEDVDIMQHNWMHSYSEKEGEFCRYVHADVFDSEKRYHQHMLELERDKAKAIRLAAIAAVKRNVDSQSEAHRIIKAIEEATPDG
ncbi:hypothetical protein [Thalassobius sp. Cn5-15]|uniref:hypothetical protein n=1 Tax=Thalassobius sp. Cn5-15 TaxID=2917763 RepID=UPI001EF32A2D|nr:hypothetical protein [Thalassobius sp. Cn5-15]MCG7492443.1 hypothetical protein [Thalassobius sp. Cn5-15]